MKRKMACYEYEFFFAIFNLVFHGLEEKIPFSCNRRILFEKLESVLKNYIGCYYQF